MYVTSKSVSDETDADQADLVIDRFTIPPDREGYCSAVEPSCPECPPGEDSVSSMPACMSEDELLGDVLPATPVVPNVLYTIGASSTYRGMLPGPLIGFAPPVGPCGTRAPCGISRHEDKNKDDTDGSEATGSRPVRLANCTGQGIRRPGKKSDEL